MPSVTGTPATQGKVPRNHQHNRKLKLVAQKHNIRSVNIYFCFSNDRFKSPKETRAGRGRAIPGSKSVLWEHSSLPGPPEVQEGHSPAPAGVSLCTAEAALPAACEPQVVPAPLLPSAAKTPLSLQWRMAGHKEHIRNNNLVILHAGSRLNRVTQTV